MQLLHQAATLGSEWNLFVIGNEQERIMHGTWVHFSPTLLYNYMLCMHDIKGECLSFAYKALSDTENCLVLHMTDQEMDDIKASKAVFLVVVAFGAVFV